MNLSKDREIWIDIVKLIACILVVLGHFFQSMVKSGIIDSSLLFRWFNDTIYYFHVPLFFICSGYLYQKYACVIDIESWKGNVLGKMISLGIPYFVFSLLTFVLKIIGSNSVNSPAGDLTDSLFINPISPYWFLYVLFFVFLLTPTIRTQPIKFVLICLAGTLRILYVFSSTTGIFALDKLMCNLIWFIFGMLIADGCIVFLGKLTSWLLFVFFILGSIYVERASLQSGLNGFILGFIACYSIISIVYRNNRGVKIQRFVARFAEKNTFSIFLMHTIFASFIRIYLLKMNIYSPLVHFALGLTMSFLGPVLAMMIMERFKPIDFIVYPLRYIKLKG